SAARRLKPLRTHRAGTRLGTYPAAANAVARYRWRREPGTGAWGSRPRAAYLKEETPMSTTIDGKAVLVTGANRGIGQALVTEALRRGASRVSAGTRQPYAHQDARVTPLELDITSEGQVRAAAAQVGSLDILVNNAGVFLFDDLSDRAALERHLA